MTAETRTRASNMTFSVPEDIKRRAQTRRDVNWSAVVSQTIEERLQALELMDRVLANSRLTRKDVDELSDVINTAIAKRHGIK